MKHFGAITLLCSAALLTACSQLQQQQNQNTQDEETKVTIPPPLHLGAVHQVYPDRGFALLRMLGPVPAPGTTLISHPADGSNDRIGNLCVSEASGSRNGIIAADIRSGTVAQGDRVFLYREIAPPEPQEQEETSDSNGDDTVTAESNEPIRPDAAPSIPEPEPQQVETTVLPEATTPAKTPSANSTDGIPDSIRDVPESINDWDNM